MKIESNSSMPTVAGGRTPNGTTADPETATGKSDTGTPLASGDRFTLTGAAGRIKELTSQLENQPRVDHRRVDAVKEAIANGTFEVDPKRIADRLIAIEQGLSRPL